MPKWQEPELRQTINCNQEKPLITSQNQFIKQQLSKHISSLEVYM